MRGDNVDLAMARAVAARKDCVPATSQLTARGVFSQRTKVGLMRCRHVRQGVQSGGLFPLPAGSGRTVLELDTACVEIITNVIGGGEISPPTGRLTRLDQTLESPRSPPAGRRLRRDEG